MLGLVEIGCDEGYQVAGEVHAIRLDFVLPKQDTLPIPILLASKRPI